jgi:hypothetical protein
MTWGCNAPVIRGAPAVYGQVQASIQEVQGSARAVQVSIREASGAHEEGRMSTIPFTNRKRARGPAFIQLDPFVGQNVVDQNFRFWAQ